MEAYLDACVTSLVQQTYTNLEILLIDDGSPDNCPTMCDAWAERDARVRVIHSENHGVSHARNLGLRAATGAFLGFCDADDWIDADYYATLIDAMQADAAEIAVGGYIRDTGTGTYMRLRRTPARSYSRREALAEMFQAGEEKAFWWELCDKVFQRKLFDGLSLDEDIYVAEDMLLCGQVFFHAHRVAFRPLYGYHYRVRAGSATEGGLPPVKADTGVLANYRLWQKARATGEEEILQAVAPICCPTMVGTLRRLFSRPDYDQFAEQAHALQREIRENAGRILGLPGNAWKNRLGCLVFCLPYPVVVCLRPLLRKHQPV